jgi:hypothetical protein
MPCQTSCGLKHAIIVSTVHRRHAAPLMCVCNRTYEMVVSDQSWLAHQYYRYIVLDEAQRIKNEEAYCSQAVSHQPILHTYTYIIKMYVCTYVHTYIYTHIHMDTYMDARMDTYIYTCLYTPGTQASRGRQASDHRHAAAERSA